MAGAAFLVTACTGRRETLLTYFNGEYAVSLRYPAGWKAEQGEQDGVWYRRFQGPPAGPAQTPAVSATLLVGKPAGTLDEFVQAYTAGKGSKVVSSRDESRQGARGRAYLLSSADGSHRYSLLLLEDEGRVVGLCAEGEAPLFERSFGLLEEMTKSLTFERPASYPLQRNDRFGFVIGIPPSWRESREFAGGGTMLLQFQSPPLLADRDGQAVHAYLNVAVETLEAGTTMDDYYTATRRKLGDTFLVLSHGRWKGGYVDVARMETPLAVSRVKRFYCVDNGRGYSLSFEAREDVYPRAARWYDLIASTFKTRSELASK